MPLRVLDLVLPVDHAPGEAEAEALRRLGVQAQAVRAVRIRRRSLDARKGRPPRFVYQVDVEVRGNPEAVLRGAVARGVAVRWVADEGFPPPEPGTEPLRGPVVVVGAGPCGLFAAYRLALRGFRPLVVERGRPVRQRLRDLRAFRLFGRLDPESNILFGEGGAGMFSDGKLTTRIKSPLVEEVLRVFHAAGAPETILYEAHPHVGSNLLPKVLARLRQDLERRGVSFHFETRVRDVEMAAGSLAALQLEDRRGGRERLEVGAVILAPGSSARDLFAVLAARGVPLEPRPVPMGVRVEHPQELVDRNQLGSLAGCLGSAEYFLAFKPEELGADRPVYSFCMCPGGEVIAVATEPGGVSTNGMSNYSRKSGFANAAFIAPVRVAEYGGKGVLGGVAFQRRLEAQVFVAGGGDYALPAQRLPDFLAGRASRDLPPGPKVTRRRPGAVHALVPPFLAPALRAGLEAAERALRGFLTAEATVYGLEVRTASPVRILRGPDGQSPGARNLYPAGEGAGYAGGIVSAAVDGMEQADRVIARFAVPAGGAA